MDVYNSDVKKVAILDNSIDPTVYTPVIHWSGFLDIPWEAFRVKTGEYPNLDEEFTHLIVTGSEASILYRESWVEEEVVFLQKAMDKGFPILGSCYGHQLLGLAISGPNAVRRCEPPEMGWLPIKIHEDTPFLGKKGEFYSFTLHFDEVFNLDNDYRILASTDICAVHAFQYQDKPIWGVQSHPEIDIAAGKQLLSNLIALNTEATSLFEEALLSKPQDSGAITQILHHFLQ